MPDHKPSLIQQRMTLDRARSRAILGGVIAVFLCVVGVARVLDSGAESTWFEWSGLVIAALLLGVYVVHLLRAWRALTAFEDEHGRDAGRQKPVSGA